MNEVNINVGGPINNGTSTYKTVILKPNLSLQSQMQEENCKYIIKWDYNLNDESLNVPANCIISIEGGSITGGTIVGNNTIIMYEGRYTEAFKGEIAFEGTCDIKTLLAADEEDIHNNNGVLKFADKDYNADAQSGLGRVYLRQNMQTRGYEFAGLVRDVPTTSGTPSDIESSAIYYDLINDVFVALVSSTYYLSWTGVNAEKYITPQYGERFLETDDNQLWNWIGRKLVKSEYKTNVLTQDMINKPNTRYIIQYDFNLLGGEITIPANCILDFKGGSLNDGLLIGQDTYIETKDYTIFNRVKLKGSITNDFLKANWFGIHCGESYLNYNTTCIPQFFGYSAAHTYTPMFFDEKGTYYTADRPITSQSIDELPYFSNSGIYGTGRDTIIKVVNNNYRLDIINLVNAKNVSIHDISLTEESNPENPAHGANGISLITSAENIEIYNVYIFDLPFNVASARTSDGGNAFTFQAGPTGAGCKNLKIFNCECKNCASLLQNAYEGSLGVLQGSMINCKATDILCGFEMYKWAVAGDRAIGSFSFISNHIDKCKIGIFSYDGHDLIISDNYFNCVPTEEKAAIPIFDDYDSIHLMSPVNISFTGNVVKGNNTDNYVNIFPYSSQMQYNDVPEKVIISNNILYGGANDYGIKITTKPEAINTFEYHNNVIKDYGIAQNNIDDITIYEPNGFIVIYDSSGNGNIHFVNYEDYDSESLSDTETAIGVAIIYDSSIFIISKEEKYTVFGTFASVKGFTTPYFYKTINDNHGPLNTEYFYQDDNDANHAVGYCKTLANNPAVWYLGTVKEHFILKANFDKINKLLSLINGTLLKKDNYYTSTSYDATYAYTVHLGTGVPSIKGRGNYLYVRPVAMLNINDYIVTDSEQGFFLGQKVLNISNNKEVIWDGVKWLDFDGAQTSVNRSGTWANRPTTLIYVYEGLKYMINDGDNHFPIYAHINNSTIEWYKADGTRYTGE